MPKIISGTSYAIHTTWNGTNKKSSPSPSMQDEEDPEDYNPGGYLNVKVGDEFMSPNRSTPYTAVRKLGWGNFSTVWLAMNEDDGRYVAVKVSSSRYADTAKDEISLLMKARKNAFKAGSSRRATRSGTQWEVHPGSKHVVSLLDYFSTSGRFRDDTHVCMVFEPLGETLLNLLDKYRYGGQYDGQEGLGGVPTSIVKVVAKQVLMGLQYLHDECGLVHTDIKPENILLALPNTQDHIRAQLAASPTLPSRRVTIPSKRSKRGDRLPRRARHVDMYLSQPIARTPLHFESKSSDQVRGHRRHASAYGPDDSPQSSRSSRSSRDAFGRQGRDQPFPVNVQISDLGNATPADRHFTEDIQTRQYRSPEAIIRKGGWGCPVDIWSVACLVFELLTGDHLFDPRAKDGFWEKDDDHMGQIIELCGDFDLSLKTGGKYSRELFTSRGKLRRIRHLKPVPLTRVLIENYNYHSRDAQKLAAFLSPMLRVDPVSRATARESMAHAWVDSWDEGDLVPRPRTPQRMRRSLEWTPPLGFEHLEHNARRVVYK